MDCGETVTSRRAYKYEEDGRGPGRWGSVAPNRLGSETVFPFAHAGENLLGSHSLLIWMVGRQTLRWDYFTFARHSDPICFSEGIDRRFSPIQAELSFRISVNIAAYLEPPGRGRHVCFQDSHWPQL